MSQSITQDPVQYRTEAILRLIEKGENEEALAQFNTWLSVHPQDADAALHKAEIYLAMEHELSFIADVLVQPQDQSERVEKLRTQVDRLVQEKLAKGQNAVKSHSLRNTLSCFQAAVTLSPNDAAVPLSVGMALLHLTGEEPLEELRSPLEILTALVGPIAEPQIDVGFGWRA